MRLSPMSTRFPALYRFLRWSERYTKTDMVYLFTGGFWLLTANIIVTLFSFAVLFAFANFIPEQTYGEYRFVISIFEVLYVTTLSGLVTSLSQAVASGHDGNFKEIVRTRLLYGLIGTILAFGVGIYYLLKESVTLGWVFIIFAFAVPLIPTTQLYTSYLLGKKSFKRQSLYSIYARIGTAIVLIPVLYFSSDLILILGAFFISNLVINIILTRLTLKAEPPNKRIKEGSISYGKHVSVVETFSTLASNVDKLIVWKFLGPIPLASFLIASAIPQELITRIVGIFTTLAFPKFGESNSIRPVDVLAKISTLASFMTVPVAIYIVSVPFLFKTFFPQYVETTFYAQILSLVLIFAPFTIIASYFGAKQMTRMLYLTSIGDLVLKIILFIPLVFLYGMIGAAVAAVSFFAARSAFYAYLLLTSGNHPHSQ